MLQDGDTALHQAAQRSYGSYIEVVKLLVKYGASVDIANMVASLLYSWLKDTNYTACDGPYHKLIK